MTHTARLLLTLFIGLAPAASAEGPLDGLPPIGEDTIRLFIVRHTETYHNVNPGMDPASEKYYAVTPAGEEMARAVGAALKGQPVVSAYHSETERTQKTLEFMKEGGSLDVSIESEAAFNRVIPGLKEDGTPGDFGWRVQLWSEGDDPSPPEGESMREACERFFERIRAEEKAYGKAMTVSTHGDILAGVLGAAEARQPWERWDYYKDDMPCPSLHVIDIPKGGPAVLRMLNVPYR